MLFRLPVLEGIAAGRIDRAFRRWSRPTVKAGGFLQTPAGRLAIESVEPVTAEILSEAEARKAGHVSLQDLRRELAARTAGTLYRIRFRLEGPDPRLALRASEKLSPTDIAALTQRLERWDAASAHGPWTRTALGLIRDRPHVRAGDLAAKAGVPKEWFKIQVRKLKNLGLTVSHEPGYELSPRGRSFLKALDRARRNRATNLIARLRKLPAPKVAGGLSTAAVLLADRTGNLHGG